MASQDDFSRFPSKTIFSDNERKSKKKKKLKILQNLEANSDTDATSSSSKISKKHKSKQPTENTIISSSNGNISSNKSAKRRYSDRTDSEFEGEKMKKQKKPKKSFENIELTTVSNNPTSLTEHVDSAELITVKKKKKHKHKKDKSKFQNKSDSFINEQYAQDILLEMESSLKNKSVEELMDLLNKKKHKKRKHSINSESSALTDADESRNLEGRKIESLEKQNAKSKKPKHKKKSEIDDSKSRHSNLDLPKKPLKVEILDQYISPQKIKVEPRSEAFNQKSFRTASAINNTSEIEEKQNTATVQNSSLDANKSNSFHEISFPSHILGSNADITTLQNDDDDLSDDYDFPSYQKPVDSFSKDFASINITVNHQVPQLHLLQKCTSRGLSTDQWQTVKELGLRVKQTNYSKTEDDIILRNWKEFCETYDVPNDPQKFLLNYLDASERSKCAFKPEERVNFLQFMGKGLDNRLLSSILNRIKVLFSDYIKDKFSPEEDDLILFSVKNSRSRRSVFAELAKELNRSRIAVQKRFITLSNQEEYDFDENCKIGDEEATTLIQYLIEVTKVGNIAELKNVLIPIGVFKAIGVSMKIKPQRLSTYWYLTLHPRLFARNVVNFAEVRLKLINLIIKDGIRDFSEVRFKKYLKHFDGWTGMSLAKCLKNLLEKPVTAQLYKKHFTEALQIHQRELEEMPPFLLNSTANEIKQLEYIDGELIQL